MKKTQLIKGVLEGCVLAIIRQKPIYGYELMQLLKQHGFTTLAGGTLYPLLQKLEVQGLISGKMQASPEGPDRKYFYLTVEGEHYLGEFTAEWTELVHNVNEIMDGKEAKS